MFSRGNLHNYWSSKCFIIFLYITSMRGRLLLPGRYNSTSLWSIFKAMSIFLLLLLSSLQESWQYWHTIEQSILFTCIYETLLITCNMQKVAMAIKCLLRKMWSRSSSQTAQKLRVLPSHYMFCVSTGLEYINITPPMTLCIIYFKNSMLHIFCITSKIVNVEWVRPRAKESSLGSPVCNKSYGIMNFLHSSSICM